MEYTSIAIARDCLVAFDHIVESRNTNQDSVRGFTNSLNGSPSTAEVYDGECIGATTGSMPCSEMI